MKTVSESEARSESSEVAIGQSARPDTALAVSGVDQNSLQSASARIGLRGVEIAPIIVLACRRQRGLPPQPQIQHQVGTYSPVILRESGERGPLLADIAQGIDLTAV